MARRPSTRTKTEPKPTLFEPAPAAAPEVTPPAPSEPAKMAAPAKPRATKAAPAKPTAAPSSSAPAKPAQAKAAPPKAKPAPRRAAPKAAPATMTSTPKPAEAAAKPAAIKASTAKPAAPKAPTPKPAAAATPAGGSPGDMQPRLRAMAERNVEQARTAYAEYVGVSERMLDALDDGSRKAWSGARDVNMRILGFAEANAKAGFDFAERFLKVSNLAELAKLQRDYLKQTTERLSSQMREIQQITQEATRSALPKTGGD